MANNFDDREHFCSICHRPESQAGSMLTLPGGISVCMDCLQKTMDHVQQSGLNLGNVDLNNLDLSNLGSFPFMGFPFGQPSDGGDPESDDELDEDVAESEDDVPVISDGKDLPVKSEDGEGSDVSPDEPGTPDVPDPGKKAKDKKQGKSSKRTPSISFINLADLQGGFGRRAQVKRKDPTERKGPLIDPSRILPPHKLKEKLDEYVVGQDKAKKSISVAVYNHYKRILAGDRFKDDVEIEKSNMLLIGPTGCGKTYIVKTLAKLLDVPLAITDATSLTEAGYIGDDIESVLSKLLQAADNDLDRAEIGIVFIDEIDKIAKKNSNRGRDVSGESVQQGLLKLLEGAEVEVPVGAASKNAMVPLTTVNTRNILFICGGAFPDLEDIVKERLKKKTSMGFGAELKDKYEEDENILDKVTTEDLRKFGMIPEFLGRLPIVCTLQKLSGQMLVQVLKEPKNAILKQYQRLLEMDEVLLEFEDDALLALTKRAEERGTGARGLRSILEEIMLDIMYEIPKDDSIGKVTITKDYVENHGAPLITIRSNDRQPLIAQLAAPADDPGNKKSD